MGRFLHLWAEASEARPCFEYVGEEGDGAEEGDGDH